MANARRDYLRRTREVRMRELHHSTGAWIGLGCGLAAAFLFLIAVIMSFRNGGEALYAVGVIGMFGLVLSVGGLVLGILGIREEDARPLPPIFSTAIGGGMTVVLAILFFVGF